MIVLADLKGHLNINTILTEEYTTVNSTMTSPPMENAYTAKCKLRIPLSAKSSTAPADYTVGLPSMSILD